jgi:uncharacterized membrane protein (UPF0127 family)
MTDFVIIAGKKIPTILAITTDEQESGLMYKKWPPPVMSFVYATPRINKFWMKNCISPLDIVFSNKGQIISICAGEPNSTRVIGDDKPSDLVVEFPAGTCKAFDIRVGHTIELEYSDDSKMKIFSIKNGFTI